jgi:hypothetical protein
MSILYRKGSVNETDAVSRRPDFFHPDDVHLRMLVEMFALWWDGDVLDPCYQRNYITLLVQSTDIVSIDDDFLTKLKITYSSWSYFSNEKTQWKGRGLIKSFDGLFTYHDGLVIPRQTQVFFGYSGGSWSRLFTRMRFVVACWWCFLCELCVPWCAWCVGICGWA